jgi:hypothetical protein
MAKKQSRRTVSMNRSFFEAVKKEAARRGQTLAGFVESALVAAGVPAVDHQRQSVAQVARHPSQKADRIADRRHDTHPVRPPSRERQVLGDGVANALGFA